METKDRETGIFNCLYFTACESISMVREGLTEKGHLLKAGRRRAESQEGMGEEHRKGVRLYTVEERPSAGGDGTEWRGVQGRQI